MSDANTGAEHASSLVSIATKWLVTQGVATVILLAILYGVWDAWPKAIDSLQKGYEANAVALQRSSEAYERSVVQLVELVRDVRRAPMVPSPVYDTSSTEPAGGPRYTYRPSYPDGGGPPTAAASTAVAVTAAALEESAMIQETLETLRTNTANLTLGAKN